MEAAFQHAGGRAPAGLGLNQRGQRFLMRMGDAAHHIMMNLRCRGRASGLGGEQIRNHRRKLDGRGLGRFQN